MSKVYVEGELIIEKSNCCQVHFPADHTGNSGAGIFVDKDKVHNSLPSQEPEWVDGEWMSGFKAMYLAEKYGLEIRFRENPWMEYSSPNWYQSFGTLEVIDWVDKLWQLRKPVSAKDRLREILKKRFFSEQVNPVMEEIEAAGLLREG